MRYFLGIIIVSILISCAKESISLNQYLRDERMGLRVVENLNDQKLTLQQVPVDWIIQKEIENGIIQLDEQDSRRLELVDFEHYQIDFVDRNLTNTSDILIEMQQNEQIVHPVIFHSESTGSQNLRRYLLAFQKSDLNDNEDRIFYIKNKKKNSSLKITALSINTYEKKIVNNEISIK